MVNLFIVYKLDRRSRDINTDFTLKDCLFRTVKLTKNVVPDKYKYSSYSIGFDSRSQFLFAWEKMLLILEYWKVASKYS